MHAGGIVWYGQYLYVAGGQHGIRVFRLDDLVRVRNRFRTKSYRYVLPQFTSYDAGSRQGVGEMMYSFMSLDRSGDEDHLVAGEYGRKGGSHRLMRYPLDRETELLRSRRSRVGRAGRAVRPSGRAHAGRDAGRRHLGHHGEQRQGQRPGDLWVGRPGDYVRHAGVLPTGPEDITYWPQRGQLWSVTEWPRQRWVYAIDADKWVKPARRAHELRPSDG